MQVLAEELKNYPPAIAGGTDKSAPASGCTAMKMARPALTTMSRPRASKGAILTELGKAVVS
jgi:hypothetical protein